jgi:hypothetical protein
MMGGVKKDGKISFSLVDAVFKFIIIFLKKAFEIWVSLIYKILAFSIGIFCLAHFNLSFLNN